MRDPKRNDPFADVYAEFGERLRGDSWQPDIDVFETDREILVRAEIAGVRGADLRVSVDRQILRISGVRRVERPEGVERFHQMEIASGPFERRVHVPVAFDRERVSAHVADGFLTVTLPKRVPVRRQLKVDS